MATKKKNVLTEALQQFVVFSGQHDCIICTPDMEKVVVEKYFGPKDSGLRDRGLYKRSVINDDNVLVRSSLTAS